jgi:hypothetical protein
MTRSRQPLLATALAAAVLLGAVSLGAASQVQASTGARATTQARATTGAHTVASTTSVRTKISDAERAAGYVKQWKFDPNKPHHPLRAKTSFNGPANRNVNLKNSMERQFLQWEHQTWGINLGWTDDASPATAARVSRWFFTRKDTTHPIRYGDKIALGYGGSPSYVYYAHRTFGINLDWSYTPRFEWKLLGGKIGKPVRSGDWLAIYNTETKQPLIYFDRTVGGDIGWPDSETWPDQIADVAMRFIRDHWKEGVAYLITLA